jgi:rhodanese-related sulfurtransferase
MLIKNIDAKTLKDWLDRGVALVVDVRNPDEHENASIPGSMLIPIADLSTKALPKATGKKLVMHCQFGKRGSRACEKLLAEDPKLELYNLEGGLNAWASAGYSIKSKG